MAAPPVLAELAWPILERIPLVGDLAISPHGISVALGFLLGAQLMLRRTERRGVALRPVRGVDAVMQQLATRAAIGGILGARFFYVVTRLEQFSDPLSWFTVWEGGLSLLGGVAGAVLACLPYVRRERFDVRLLLDSLAPGLALGIFVGRIGDLVIGEHLGGRTDFVLGWRCSGQYVIGEGYLPAEAWPGPTVQGCFDTAVHQTALYDFLAGGILFAVLLWLERRPRFDGFFAVVFGGGYAAFRLVSDFAREADLDLVGPLTGTQVTALAVLVAITAWLLAARPWTRRPWAWAPPDHDGPWRPPPADTGEPDASEETGGPVRASTGEDSSD